VWTPQDKWQQRTGWQRVSLVVRGRKVHLRVKVAGPCRRVGWGARVFFVILVRGHRKHTKRGKSRAPMAFWVHAVSDGKDGWQLPVPLAVLLLKLWQRWELEVGFRWMKSGFGLGEKPCWGFDSGERSVAWRAWVYGALISVFAVRFKHRPHLNPPRERGGSRDSSPVHGGGWEGGMLKNQRKDTYQSRGPQFTKTSAIEAPLLKVP